MAVEAEEIVEAEDHHPAKEEVGPASGSPQDPVAVSSRPSEAPVRLLREDDVRVREQNRRRRHPMRHRPCLPDVPHASARPNGLSRMISLLPSWSEPASHGLQFHLSASCGYGCGASIELWRWRWRWVASSPNMWLYGRLDKLFPFLLCK
ncbi:hypothetical protein M758_3G159800 [Ceratodon purpureus]|uniref:Uncharacterized protein n=1 Tax=Ceratodon purpureus TaxID=3225 RepID=A0A8T0ILI7_CERPU|nr:hypothetical protein KC19_3G160400 [Ceratodon purpureus]KAG0623254.1 hypothetical protein M758_3G159800 [Ceratodon purpureus]